MAGTLTVQNLQGPTSGSNANKVLIPSGQTLDVSSGTLVPSAGAVMQVVQSTTGTRTTLSTTSYQDIDMSALITPSSSASKILVIASSTAELGSDNLSAYVSIFRGSTDINPYSGQTGFGHRYPDAGTGFWAIHYLDSPSTTSQITYAVKGKAHSGATVYFHNGGVGVLTLMEIAG